MLQTLTPVAVFAKRRMARRGGKLSSDWRLALVPTRQAMQPQSTAMAAMATRHPPPSFSTMFSIGPAQEALFSMTRPQLVRTLSAECRD